MADERDKIDKRAVAVARERGCSCGGARNCGCWNVALRQIREERS
jgi:hypothetical protein